MMLLPMFIRIQIARRDSPWPALWLPIGLAWPIVLLLCAPLLVLGYVFALLAHGYCSRRYLQMCGALYVALCAVRGSFVDVRGPRAVISIAIH